MLNISQPGEALSAPLSICLNRNCVKSFRLFCFALLCFFGGKETYITTTRGHMQQWRTFWGGAVLLPFPTSLFPPFVNLINCVLSELGILKLGLWEAGETFEGDFRLMIKGSMAWGREITNLS